MSSNIARGDISRAGIILYDLKVRVLLERGFYSREGLIWGNTVYVPYDSKIIRTYCKKKFKLTTFCLLFLEKRRLDKFILKFTDYEYEHKLRN